MWLFDNLHTSQLEVAENKSCIERFMQYGAKIKTSSHQIYLKMLN